jgi:octaprenyl-diphosphate synthase
MIEGELFQLTKTGDVDITEEEHLDIIRRKTAYLFAGCARIGGMLGKSSEAQQQALWDYGFNLGIAFQLVDDLLDYTADAATLGKPVGGDLREGKVTLPVIYLLKRAGDGAGDLVRRVVADRAVSPEDWRRLRALMAEHGAATAAYEMATDYARRAQQQLEIFPVSRERDALLALPDYVLSRDR